MKISMVRIVTSLSLGAWVILGSLVVGCSHGGKKFDEITPGMSTSDVKKTMGEGPARFEQINPEYSSWIWGDDEYCVLFKSDKVVAKDSSRTGNDISVGPGKYEEKKTAQCLAPGQVATSGTDRTVNIPGYGTVKLPSSSGSKPKSQLHQAGEVAQPSPHE